MILIGGKSFRLMFEVPATNILGIGYDDKDGLFVKFPKASQ